MASGLGMHPFNEAKHKWVVKVIIQPELGLNVQLYNYNPRKQVLCIERKIKWFSLRKQFEIFRIDVC